MTWRNVARNPDRNPAKKVTEFGITFDSKAEHARFRTLSLMERAGEIRDLKVHPVYKLEVKSFLDDKLKAVCEFEPDFRYERPNSARTEWEWVIEDVKGRRSGPAWSLFRLKAKLFEALYGRPVEVYPIIPKKPRRLRARTAKA